MLTLRFYAPLLLTLAQPAYAGGLAQPIIPVVVPPVVSPNDWYVGIQAGPGTGEVVAGQSETFVFDGDGDGLFYGVHIGVQRRFAAWTVGVELDYNISDFAAELLDPAGGPAGVAEIESLAHLKLRAGTNYGRAFLYGTAGLARVSGNGTTFGPDTFSGIGGFVGIGADYRVNDRISVGSEILTHNFEDLDDSGYDVEFTTAQIRLSYHF